MLNLFVVLVAVVWYSPLIDIIAVRFLKKDIVRPFSFRARRARRRVDVRKVYGVPRQSFWLTFPIFSLPIVSLIVRRLRISGWLFVDVFRNLINRNKLHIYGIWCFVGLPGFGKTFSLCCYLDDMRRRYGDKIYIFTNFGYKGEDDVLSGWDKILEEYDKPVIFGYDELQNEFNSREYRKFPIPLIHELTQNRKGQGKQIVYTTQNYSGVDKTFRNLTTDVVDCRTSKNKRLTTCRYYTATQFYARDSSSSLERKWQIKPYKVRKIVQTDAMRARYDSFKRLDYLKTLDYEGFQERDDRYGG